jgi:PhnB protein
MSNTNNKQIIQPYLFFGGRCEEAIEFYRKALGAEVDMVMRYKDSPEPTPPGMLAPGFENKVMHSSFRVGSNTIMASDGCSKEDVGFRGFSLSLSVETEAEAKRAFDSLADGGKVTLPLTKTFWSPCFGMLEDRFGLGWMIGIAPKAA